MDIVQSILSLISFERIMELDLIVKGPGLALALVFFLRAALALLSFRLIKAASRLFYGVFILVLLTQMGPFIQSIVVQPEEKKLEEEATLILKPAFPSDFRYSS